MNKLWMKIKINSQDKVTKSSNVKDRLNAADLFAL